MDLEKYAGRKNPDIRDYTYYVTQFRGDVSRRQLYRDSWARLLGAGGRGRCQL